MSTPQGGATRKPGTVRATPSTGTAKSPGAKPGGSKPGARPAGGGGGKRPPAVVVKQPRNWTTIWISAIVAVIALGILGYAINDAYQNGKSWQTKADEIPGLVDYRTKNPKILTNAYRTHVHATDPLVKYETTPPAYGNHIGEWQRCSGDVYDAQISNENAVHSLEHGAVWITYDPAKLTPAQVQTLASTYVTGQDFTLMSPYPNQGAPISLQAWGFQLKLDSPTDSRIKEFITDLRQNASLESGAVCSAGAYITATGTEPHEPDYVPPAAPAPSPSDSASSSASANPSPSK
jgi:hypothetical protein